MSKPKSVNEPHTPFPRLHHVLTTYIPSGTLGRDDREGEFMAAYADRGEDDPEFAGLTDEIRDAIHSPGQATPMVNEALGTELTSRETRASLKDLLDRLATNDEVEQDYDESEDFPQLQQVLLTYFPSRQRRNRTNTFLEAYETYGENKAEFAGLADELRNAVKYPKRATPMVNEALGTDLMSTEIRTHLGDLLDQITKQGDHDPEGGKQQSDAEKAKPRELLDHWFFRKVNPIPGRFRRYHFPLWQGLAGGGVSTGLGLAMLNYVPVPTWLTWIPVALITIGLGVIAMFSVTMRSLRSQMKNPQRHEKREQARVQAEANKLEKQERRSKVLRLFGP